MASQKLTFLTKIDPDAIKEEVAARKASNASPSAPAAPPARAAVAPQLFRKLGARALEDPTLGKSLPQQIQFEVSQPDSAWVVALGEDQPVRAGTAEKPVATVILSDETLAALAAGHDVRDLFQRGQLRVNGDIRIAPKLTVLRDLA